MRYNQEDNLESEFHKVVFNTFRGIAEVEIPAIEFEIDRLQKNLDIKQKELQQKKEAVKEACNTFGFVLKEIPYKQGGPFKLEVNELIHCSKIIEDLDHA